MDSAWSRSQFAGSRIGRLATVDPGGRPRVVPIVFALVGDSIVTVVDRKPKATTRLRRLDDIRANPAVCVLVDRYDEDWRELWWARADGNARIVELSEPEATEPLAALAERYPQYQDAPPPGPLIAINVRRWSGWQARSD